MSVSTAWLEEPMTSIPMSSVHGEKTILLGEAAASCGDLKAVQSLLCHANLAKTSAYVGMAGGGGPGRWRTAWGRCRDS